jgi:hypothetical protein
MQRISMQRGIIMHAVGFGQANLYYYPKPTNYYGGISLSYLLNEFSSKKNAPVFNIYEER